MFDFQGLNFDLDGDGVPDAFAQEADLNGDGIADALLLDTDQNGMVDLCLWDLDGDGYLETTEMDTDGNGVMDLFTQESDTDGDGILDQLAQFRDYDQDGAVDSGRLLTDTDGDGQYDALTQLVDRDGDGFMEESLTRLDLNGDGHPNMTVEERLADTDGDGIPDTLHRAIDHDGDQIADTVELYDFDADTGTLTLLRPDKLPMQSEPVTLETFDPSQTDPKDVCGDPAADMENWECQGDTNRCTLFSQKFVIEELTGQELDIEELADIAEANGWFSEESGGSALHMNKILDYFGIKNEMTFHNDLEDLRQSLEKGGKVIVGVDSGEIWYGETDEIFAPVDGADHAVQVIGIDNSDPENPMIILNDSGSPNGCGEMVPMDVFLDAWEDSDFQMITCYG